MNKRANGQTRNVGKTAVRLGMTALLTVSMLLGGCAKENKGGSSAPEEIELDASEKPPAASAQTTEGTDQRKEYDEASGSETGTETGTKTETGTETEAEAETETGTEAGTETAAGTGTETETGTKTKTETETGTKTGTDQAQSSGTADEIAETEEIGGDVFVRVKETVYITADRVNLRKEPSYEGTVLRQADAGESFTRTGEGGGGWDRITDESGEVYYAAGMYLSRYNPLAAAEFTWQLSDLRVVDVSKQLYSYEEMCGDLEELAETYPDHMKLSTIGETRDGREIYLARLGSPDAENAVIIQAAIHAREYMTVLIAMKQLEYYLEYYDTGYYKGIPYTDIFDKTAVYLIPMMNPDGVALSQSGLAAIRSEEVKNDIREWYERDRADGKTGYSFENYLKYFKANSHGVDLNRNFDMGWNEFGGSKVPGAEKYKGTDPGSEPESAALISLTKELSPKAAISYHASGSVLYWDYGQTGEFRKECETLTKVIAGLTGYQMMYKGNDGGVDAAGYSDWAAGVKEIPAVTIEIGTGKAPLGIEEFQTIWDKNREVFAAAAAQFLEE